MLKIKREIYDRMLSHCRDCFPLEACGILGGKNEVEKIYEIKNIETSPVSFYMDPRELFQAIKDMRAKNMDILAIYHSHPFGRALPSQKDVELAMYDAYYIIVGMASEIEVKSFVIKNGQFCEVPIQVEEDA